MQENPLFCANYSQPPDTSCSRTLIGKLECVAIRAFLEEQQPPVLFDEIQNNPELLDVVCTLVDTRPRRVGQWLFTGSQEAPLMRGITESMAGRAAVFQILPFSLAETAK